LPTSGKPVKAYFMAIVKQGTEHEVAGRLRDMKGVTEVVVTYGLYDLVVRIEVPDLSQLDALVTEIRKTDNIVQNSTLVGA
jgi:DNA-binding Lrp family transcriptional regulator